jgi:hypothetical protein
LAAKLRPANVDASAGAVEEVARIVGQTRERWPKTRIILRADSGFARESLMSLRGLLTASLAEIGSKASWPSMAEWLPGRGDNGANPRFVVTSLEASEDAAQPLYEDCATGCLAIRWWPDQASGLFQLM